MTDYLMKVNNKLVHDLQTTSTCDGLMDVVKKNNLSDVCDNFDNECYLKMHLIGEKLYSLGDAFDNVDIYNNHSTPLLVGEVQKEYEDYNLRILTKEGLKKIIDRYHNDTVTYYERLLKEGKENSIRFLTNIKEILLSLSSPVEDFLNLDNNNLKLTKSYRKEFAIFNLVSIYKFFDWDNYSIIYYTL